MNIRCFILGCLLFVGNYLYAQNAPITTAPAIGNAVIGQHVTTPITVKDFTDIGTFSLTLDYQTSALTFLSATFDPAFTGLTVNTTTPGKIIITWTGSAGITLPDQTQLLNITFTYLSGISLLTWNTTGTSCQYKKFAGGSYTVLNDSPKTSYYINGVVAAHLAPKTYAPVITNASPGTIYLPITVKNFTRISSLYLMFTYDVNTLAYQNSFTANPGLSGDFQVGNQPGLFIISWYGNPGTLTDGSTLVTLKFNYTNSAGNANFSALTWYECGPCCEYTDESSNILYDSPTGDYYFNGLVTGQVSPVTWLPSISNATPGNTIPVPVQVNGFTNIRAISLTFKYDPAVLTLPTGAFTPNPIFGGTLLVSNRLPGPDGKRTIVIGWNGSPKTLPTGSSIVTFNFNYLSGATPLRWCTGSDSCEYADALFNPLWKSPPGQYFLDGLIASHVAPITKIETGAGIIGKSLGIPVTVINFTNIGGFTLTLNYDPGVIHYEMASLASTIGGTFTSTNAGPGQLIMQWTGPPTTLPDGSILVEISFTYLGGNTSLQWFCNGNSCLVYEGLTMLPLYDQPKTTFYTTGSVSPGKSCNLSLLLESLYGGGGTLNKVQDELGDHFSETTADEITVELHKASDYSVIDYRAIKVMLNTNGLATFAVPTTFTKRCYLAIKHRNSIETITADSVSFSGSTFSYSFNTATKAFGSNMKQMPDGVYVIYVGDSNQDGIVDGSDISDIGNLADIGASGYIPEDLNGDGLVDGSDISLFGNNADAGIGAIYP